MGKERRKVNLRKVLKVNRLSFIKDQKADNGFKRVRQVDSIDAFILIKVSISNSFSSK